MEPDFLTRLPVQIPPELKTGISTHAAIARRFGGRDLAGSDSPRGVVIEDNLPLLVASVSK